MFYFNQHQTTVNRSQITTKTFAFPNKTTTIKKLGK